jgi:hypothetical protein
MKIKVNTSMKFTPADMNPNAMIATNNPMMGAADIFDTHTPPQDEVSARKRMAETEASTPSIDPSDYRARLLAESTHNPFYPVEVTGDVLHGPDSFGPAGPIPLLLKTIIMGGSIMLLVIGRDKDVEHLHDSWANVTLLVSTVYVCSSWFHTVCSCFATIESHEIDFLQNITWALYTIAGPGEIMVFLLYFALHIFGNNDDDTKDVNAYEEDIVEKWPSTVWVHAIAMFVVLVEGLIINRIPIRLLHFGIPAVYSGCYFVWSIFWVIRDVIGDHGGDAIVATIVFFVLTPIAFAIVYGLSLPSRRYSHTLNQRFDAMIDHLDYVKV